MESPADRERHLTEAELFTLAVPPAGEPEALPRHLSECLACSRALSEWKLAVRELAAEDADALSRRSSQEWEALEGKAIDAVRRTRIGRRRLSWRWMATIAAALLFAALLLPLRKTSSRPVPVPTAEATELSAQDQTDDALLRDVARLSRGDEGTGGVWNSLVPEPESGPDNEERL